MYLNFFFIIECDVEMDEDIADRDIVDNEKFDVVPLLHLVRFVCIHF
jgi:hypothetical protein